MGYNIIYRTYTYNLYIHITYVYMYVCLVCIFGQESKNKET